MSWGVLSTMGAFVCRAVWLGVLRVVAVVAPVMFGFSCVQLMEVVEGVSDVGSDSFDGQLRV